ncbi:MAG TPA: 3-phosphoserine/phosphohydroxythreonine transaminase [Flavobacteriales bacterium]|nr:3-phosphoserine/phosphohydroxythreonine transaminase [Flavobacteriales bacterium]
MSKVHNFSAGPCILPKEVLEEASQSVLNFNNLDLSILEISHRSKDIIDVVSEAESLVKELLNVPDGYKVVFLQGGASLGFLMTAYNYMKLDGEAAYINTGTWSTKAIEAARGFGEVKVIGSSEDRNFTYIPKGLGVPMSANYLHYTSNNTIFGTQFHKVPVVRCPLICDMSSDIFSREIDVHLYDLIYAGAQKNMGPAGSTVYIVKESGLGKTKRDIPVMLDLQTHIKNESMYNTPPVYSIYVSLLTMRWIKKQGGVAEMGRRNEAKAHLLYHEIDHNPLFYGTVEDLDRSSMNATFKLHDESLSEEFNKMCADARIDGIKGHRSVGGYRASMYNALPIESVQALVDVMKEFAAKKG